MCYVCAGSVADVFESRAYVERETKVARRPTALSQCLRWWWGRRGCGASGKRILTQNTRRRFEPRLSPDRRRCHSQMKAEKNDGTHVRYDNLIQFKPYLHF